MLNESQNEIRENYASDFHRPIYHYLPPSNWMNDPNGLIQWHGQYHMFYQHNPLGPLWGNIHWGHAVSDDLIHWEDLPIALVPTPDSADEAGCFSGCAVNDNGVPTFIYTGTRGENFEIQTQCVATSHDNLLTWQKHPRNPILSDVPSEANQTSEFRDPFVWNEDGTWFMLIGSSIHNVGGTAFLYRSANLEDWEYVSSILVGDKDRHGAIWECPNFFKIGDKWVLIVSAHLGSQTGFVIYFVGDFDGAKFTPIREGVIDHAYLYAPLTFEDDHNRRIMVGWLREGRPDFEQRLAGWSGAQSIPRQLGLDNQYRLTMKPVDELAQIRDVCHHFDTKTVPANANLSIRGSHLDIVAIFTPTIEGVCGITVLASADGVERTDILYDLETSTLVVRKVLPKTLTHARVIHTREVKHQLDSDEQLQLRILLDGSVLELIANERTSITSRIYHSNKDFDHIKLIGDGNQLVSLDIYPMPSIWHTS